MGADEGCSQAAGVGVPPRDGVGTTGALPGWLPLWGRGNDGSADASSACGSRRQCCLRAPTPVLPAGADASAACGRRRQFCLRAPACSWCLGLCNSLLPSCCPWCLPGKLAYGVCQASFPLRACACRLLSRADVQQLNTEAASDVLYDAIIIGSGMGGLATAARMSAKGAKVLVLEK
eukprot:357029-Chlamydomonas_euryale.AAC.3